MPKTFDHYYLQYKSGTNWETLEQLNSLAVISDYIGDRISELSPTKIRIVGAAFLKSSNNWSYEQLFYLDQYNIRLDNLPPFIFGLTNQDTPNNEKITPKLVLDEPVDGNPKPKFDNYKPRELPTKKSNLGRKILFTILALFCVILIILASLIFARHTVVLDQLNKLGIGTYLSVANKKTGLMPKKNNFNNHKPVQPLTTGQIIRHSGVAKPLLGRWSSQNCKTNFLEFIKGGYKQVAGQKSSARLTIITETIEDEFQYYIRRSPNLIEHYRKATSNAIQRYGITTENGFLRNTTKAKIFRRCR